MADIHIGKFINNLDKEDLSSEDLQGVVNNVYAKAISDHKKLKKAAEDNTKEQDKETATFVKANHDRLKANKDKVAKDINEGFKRKLKPGDSIVVGGTRVVIGNILDQYYDKDYIDIEFEDEDGNYRSWKSDVDGGRVVYKESLRKFGRELGEAKGPYENPNFDEKKFGKYFDDNNKLIPELADEYFEVAAGQEKVDSPAMSYEEARELMRSRGLELPKYIYNMILDLNHLPHDMEGTRYSRKRNESMRKSGLKEGAAEENAMWELRDQVTEYIVDLIDETGFEENLAYVVASKFKQYNPDWCGEDVNSFASRTCEKYKRMLAIGEVDVLFENAPGELVESVNKARTLKEEYLPKEAFLSGTATMPNGKDKYKFDALVWDEPSDKGLDGSNITYLEVFDNTRAKNLLIHFDGEHDRGWVKKAEDESILDAIVNLLQEYRSNNPIKSTPVDEHKDAGDSTDIDHALKEGVSKRLLKRLQRGASEADDFVVDGDFVDTLPFSWTDVAAIDRWSDDDYSIELSDGTGWDWSESGNYGELRIYLSRSESSSESESLKEDVSAEAIPAKFRKFYNVVSVEDYVDYTGEDMPPLSAEDLEDYEAKHVAWAVAKPRYEDLLGSDGLDMVEFVESDGEVFPAYIIGDPQGDRLYDVGGEILNKLESLKEGIFGKGIEYDPADGWTPELIDLHKSIDWAARNYEEYEVPGTEVVRPAHLYGGGGEKIERIPYVLKVRPNNIFPPYYGSKEFQPFEGYTSGMADGRKYDGFDIHDRFETWQMYDMMFDSLHKKTDRRLKNISESFEFEQGDHISWDERAIYGRLLNDPQAALKANETVAIQEYDTGRQINVSAKRFFSALKKGKIKIDKNESLKEDAKPEKEFKASDTSVIDSEKAETEGGKLRAALMKSIAKDYPAVEQAGLGGEYDDHPKPLMKFSLTALRAEEPGAKRIDTVLDGVDMIKQKLADLGYSVTNYPQIKIEDKYSKTWGWIVRVQIPNKLRKQEN